MHGHMALICNSVLHMCTSNHTLVVRMVQSVGCSLLFKIKNSVGICFKEVILAGNFR